MTGVNKLQFNRLKASKAEPSEEFPEIILDEK